MEPDPQVHEILARAREFNSQDGTGWVILQEAVSNVSETITVPVSNTLYESRSGRSESGKLIHLPCRTLADLVHSQGWMPDIIKIDVEPFEYEILTAPLELIAKLKPVLQLEAHWEILNRHNLGADRFLKPLADWGYQGIPKSIAGWTNGNGQA